MNIFRIKDNQIIWPYSWQQLRQDEPWLSISANPHAGEIASWLQLDPPIVIIAYQPAIQPEFDPRTERIEEAEPVETPDGWFQTWAYRPATPEEIAAYDLAQLPPPQWREFAVALILLPETSTFLATLPAAPARALEVALANVANGAGADLLLALLQGVSLPAGLAAEIGRLAQQYHLPAAIIEALT
jgi:hypothetical protein